MSPSHYIRTVRTPYTARPSSSIHSSASTSSNENHTVENPQTSKYPPGLGFGTWRTSLASLSTVNINQLVGGSGKRAQRPSIRIPYAGRRALPSPPQRSNPYAAPIQSVVSYDPAPLANTYATYESYADDVPRSTHVVQPITVEPQSFDRDARSKLVAGILLHRVHAVGKPMRRRPGDVYPRSYIRSGLSRMVSVEA